MKENDKHCPASYYVSKFISKIQAWPFKQCGNVLCFVITEPSGNATMEAETDKDNDMCELVTEETSTKQGTSEDTSKQGTFDNTSTIISAKKHITEDVVNTESTTTRMSVTEHITGEESSEQGTSGDTSTNESGRKPTTKEGARDVGTSDDSPKRKSGRTPVPKQFPDEVNGSVKRIRLENVHSEAEEVTESCPVERIGRFSGEMDQL